MNKKEDGEIEEALMLAWKKLSHLRQHADQYPAVAWSPELKARLQQPGDLPEAPSPLNEVVEQAFSRVLEGYCNVSHPLYLGYISPKPLAETVLGDLIASMLNQTPGAWRAGPSATQIESETLSWIRTFMGLDAPASGQVGGLITSGGSMANLLALKLARDRYFPEALEQGMSNQRGRPVVYMSSEGHFSVLKAADMLGLGRKSVRLIQTDRDGRIDLAQLEQSIQKDRLNHQKAICIIGLAGTSATGAVDDLDALADMAQRHDCWYHIDGAAGLALASLPAFRAQFQGMQRADSLSLDPCKWMFAAFGLGCFLLRDETPLRQSFDVIGHYWQDSDEPEFFRSSFYGTRQWRSLGLWLAFKRIGAQGYRVLLENICLRAQQFRLALAQSGHFDLLGATTLPVCCFRPKASSVQQASTLAEALMTWVNETGDAYLTRLDWHGEYYLRAAFNNIDTTEKDVGHLLDVLEKGLRAIG
jgi:aromatic-L-amino-acid decarboxylase